MSAAQRVPDVSWQAVFGHDEPYPEQADGIDAAIDAADDDGFLVVEGACGTGKTMLALTAGIDRVRDPDSKYERVLVLTSVKQQLRQFEADLETINANLPTDWRPVSGLTLVGKADVCPYSRESVAGIDDETVYDRCEGLRERTRNLVGEDGQTSTGTLVSEAKATQTGLLDSGATQGPEYLSTAGEPTPFLPETAEYADTEYCPFYATFLDDLPEDGDPVEAVPFDLTDCGHIDTDELVRLSAGYGTCPHSVMGAVLPHVEVVLGNYYHAFDPQTVGSFTGALVDDATFVVCDEAHMLEPRVRDLVSDGVGLTTLRDAEQELTRVIQPVEFDDAGKDAAGGSGSDTGSADADLVRGELADSDVTLRELREVRAFVSDLRSEVDRRVKAHLDRSLPDWRADVSRLEDDEIPLRDPEAPAVDDLTEWADDAGYDGGTWVRAESVGAVVARILNEAEDEDVRRAAPAAGRALANWKRCDHVSYFREIELERTWDETESQNSWRRAYNARLALHNCVPGETIAERLGEFGGGVLMSATLEPMDVFREVTGLDALAERGRPVEERTYGLSFPAANRASFAVDVPKFTHENRGRRGESNPTRRAHVDAVAEIARSPGNVLVGMPNYGEASWMAEALADRLDRPVLLDESSGDDATEALKAEFFGGEPKVLVTSLRGTLTEGVDYRGDRLAAAAVCGVPLIDTSSPRTRALRTAYDRRFGGGGSDGRRGRSGFETALTVPAVRKARQAIGRVIRGPEEVGIRALIDARYARASWDSVREYLPETEREEFDPVSPDMLGYGVDRFWSRAGEE
ncbi:ATP-dependent DNA helicase [Halobellus rubicundus]|uniref:ATP-dependent DNA helicase n=1 Tax=Halobellus rubicundus TaxID=2996466 RepID=A0ABD5MBC5_9EURY